MYQIKSNLEEILKEEIIIKKEEKEAIQEEDITIEEIIEDHQRIEESFQET